MSDLLCAPPEPIRILVAEDHPIVLDGILARLRAEPDFEVVGATSDGRRCVELFFETSPDVVLTDQVMPGMSGLEVVAALRAARPDAKVLVLSAVDERALVAAALGAGAAGYLHKTLDGARLASCIRRAAAGESVLDEVGASQLVEELRAARPPRTGAALSAREREVLTLVARGMTNAEVAAALYLSVQTVKTHLARAYAKLDVNDRAAAVYKASQAGLLG